MKTCPSCQTPKEPTEFNRSARRKDGLQVHCRACSNTTSKAHYEANPTYYRKKARSHKAEVIAAVVRLKEGRPCCDCKGTFHPVAMDFDHRDPSTKVGSISALARQAGWSLERVLEEVSKCDLVCANCHRVRTHNAVQGSSRKSTKKFH